MNLNPLQDIAQWSCIQNVNLQLMKLSMNQLFQEKNSSVSIELDYLEDISEMLKERIRNEFEYLLEKLNFKYKWIRNLSKMVC